VEATVLSNMILLQDIAFDMNKIHETSISINMTKQLAVISGLKMQSQARVNKQLNIPRKLLS
jgi:ribulose 1,5-bisphosphate carboxylase large subunit-like protein